MSDEEKKVSTEPEQSVAESNPSSAEKSVKKGALSVLLLIVLSLAWYLASDRYTPYTQQARIQGFVIGVAAKVSGVVTNVLVKNDQMVRQGQTLFEVDQSQYVIALNKAKSGLETTRKQIGAGTAGIESAQANLLAAEANAQKAQQDASRQERLYKEDKGAISVRRLEMSRASLKQAQAKVMGAMSEIQRAKEQQGGDDEDNAQLKAALSAVQKAELDLANTQVKASTGGVITDLRADVGQFASAGVPVMTLIAIQNYWVRAEFTENNLAYMKVGTPVDLVIDVLPGKVFSGKVRSIGIGVAVGQVPAAGTLPTLENSRDWLRQSQRYPVIIDVDEEYKEQIRDYVRIGGQVEVMAYSDKATLTKLIGKVYIRIMSYFSYAY